MKNIIIAMIIFIIVVITSLIIFSPDSKNIITETQIETTQITQEKALEEWTIEGDKVFVDDDNIYVSASPHTLGGSDWVIFNFTSKVFTGNIDAVLGFDTTTLQPQTIERFNPTTELRNVSYTCETDYFNYTTSPNHAWCYENITEYIDNSTYNSHLELIWDGDFDSGDLPSKTVTWEEQYLDIWKSTSLNFDSTNYEYQGMNKWWYTQDVPITQDTEYVFRVYIKNLDPFGAGHKYWFAIKPSSESISEAVSSGHLYALDPWTSSLGNNLVAYYNFSTWIESVNGGEWNLTTGDGTPEVVSNASCLNLEDQSCGFIDSTNEYWNVTAPGFFGLNESTEVKASKCYWLRRDASTGAYMSKGNNDAGWMDSIHGGDNFLNIAPTNGTGNDNTTYTEPIPTKEWYHICWVRNDTHVGLFVNGTLYNVEEGRITVVETNNLEIGGSTKHGSYLGNFYIDELAFWNKSLTASEVSDLYNGGSGITYDPLSDMELTITLNSPINSFSTIETQINFSGSFSIVGTDTNLTNATLYSWYSNGSLYNTNYTEINGTTNATNRSFGGIPTGNYLWNYQACGINDTATKCEFSASNRSFQITAFTENQSVFNNSVFETSLQGFWINVTYDTGRFDDINATFWYNNTEYVSEVEEVDNSGEVLFNITGVQTPTVGQGTNISFHWEIELDEGGSPITQNTSRQNQTLNELYFDVCNETLADIFLNISFQNETILEEAVTAFIPSSTITFWLGGASTNQSVTYVNATENLNYTFCGNATNEIINILVELDYDNSESQQRNFIGTFALNNTVTTEQTLLLLPTSDGVYVTFQVVNAPGEVISGVEVNVSSSGTLIETGVTDDAGSITFFLDPDTSYDFTFLATGYNLYSTSITPTETEYTITLGSSTTQDANELTRGISWTINPLGQYLYNNTDHTFNFTLTSSYWEVESFGFVLTNITGSNLASNTVNSNGGTATDDFNTDNQTLLIMNYFWVIDGNYTNQSYSWYVQSDSGTGFGLTNLFSRVKTYTDAGIFGIETEGFSMALITFLLIFLITGIMSYKYGLNSPAAIMGIAFTITLFLNVGIDIIPTGTSSLRYFPTILMGLLFVGVLFRENFR